MLHLLHAFIAAFIARVQKWLSMLPLLRPESISFIVAFYCMRQEDSLNVAFIACVQKCLSTLPFLRPEVSFNVAFMVYVQNFLLLSPLSMLTLLRPDVDFNVAFIAYVQKCLSMLP